MAGRKKLPRTETIPWAFHPRVFTSLGADLVTNDLVAFVELMKNAYDAFAHRVDIRFSEREDTGDQTMEVQDDGHGMDRQTIVSSWFMVGTPYRAEEKSVRKGKKTRRVTGEKGIGRLSAARLGKKLSMYTKKAGEPCFRVNVDWEAMASATSLMECNAEIRQVPPPDGLGDHGTLLRIEKLNRTWDFDEHSDLPDLQTELGRFVPPFKEKTDFRLYLTLPSKEPKPVRIKLPKILSHPTYVVEGTVDERGELTVEYQYLGGDGRRSETGRINLTQKEPRLRQGSWSVISDKTKFTKCGPFDFEFRVWDLDKDTLLELGKRFDLGKKVTVIRRLIADSPFSGISLYRDGILVLPKELGTGKQELAAGRDWLGLDLRRISRVGKRVSTHQIIGYLNISADGNPRLRDTADRERLVDNSASRQFRRFLFRIIEFLENEREKDRTQPEHEEPPLQDLFGALRSPALPNKLADIESRDGDWDEIREAVDEHTRELDRAVGEIQQRFYYYSRLASVGSLAMLLQHEVGNKVSVISGLNKYLRKNRAVSTGLRFLWRKLELSENAARSLQRLADIFSPLASRAFATRRRNSVLEEMVEQIGIWHEKEMGHSKVKFGIKSDPPTEVAVDPGELIPIIDNLMTNSLYWLKKVPSSRREVLVEVLPCRDKSRVEVRFHDSGPGVEDGLEEKIFWPGVTKKEGGIGMGLTVASELVAQRQGKMYLIKPGDLGGATFGFDLPLVRTRK